MEQQLPPVTDGYDVVIKILTIIKLLLQVAFWGLGLGLTIWLLLNNPIPKLMTAMQDQLVKSFMNK